MCGRFRLARRGQHGSISTVMPINTVNTGGIMGKGIALQFRRAHPENYEAYRITRERGEVEPGRVLVFHTGQLGNPRFIISFRTKRTILPAA